MRVVIVVASKHGSTEDLGEVVAQRLRERGVEAVLAQAAELTDLAGFDAVIVGGAVYAGRLLPVVRALGTRWGERIGALPNYVFASGPLGAAGEPPCDALELAQTLGSRKVAVFPGRAVSADLGATERAVLRMVGLRDGDYRDLADVRAWADSVAADLRDLVPAQPADRPAP
ncbi:MAG: flavodoxin domain-containing protein [Bifidobacteriaceae bacterium]|jgi:menaquinone-dependent protoporphyrinogen oxidase|nr:flavodoxin domain-containing protein [Bifidobacteriaceae bacterium]